MNEMVPRNELMKQGGKAVGGIGGGAALLIVGALSASTVPAIIIGGVLTVFGLIVASKSKEDKLAGGVVAGAGILTFLKGMPFLHSLAGGLLWISGVGLIVAGGVSLYKFIKGLKARG
ncbi:MAG TPA: hypothetical protein VMW73_01090 [Spirochaetia bacterium]|nr:hypothetical protein [Spirochaetia bacterium]